MQHFQGTTIHTSNRLTFFDEILKLLMNAALVIIIRGDSTAESTLRV